MRKKNKHLWNKNAKYRNWVKDRDKALEDLHTHAQLEISDIVRDMLGHVLLVAKAQYHGMKEGYPGSVDWFEAGVRHKFQTAAGQLFMVVASLRTRSYTLARASESEIIAQLRREPTKSTITKIKLHELKFKQSVIGGHILHRINLYCDKLRRKITSYAQSAAMTSKDEVDFARSISVAFPRARRVKIPRRILKPQLMEAQYSISDDPQTDIAIDNIDDEAWQDMLDAYKKEYVPKTRAPEFVVDQPEVTGENTWYAWEFERDMTNEFVQSVRDGQIDAANENGITDFVWIAVVDDRTDRCCLWRDGLLVSEIEDQIADHQDEDDECSVDDGEGLTPPIHFNCRCTLAPATDNMPEKADDGSKDFQDWLNS